MIPYLKQEKTAMGLHKMLMQLTFLWVVLAAIATDALAAQLAKPGCQSSCGDVTIPYPFGTSDGCYMDTNFQVTCDTTSDTSVTYYKTGSIQILDISLQGELRVSADVAYRCYDESGNVTSSRSYALWLSKFSNVFISEIKNKFIAVGCDTIAYIKGSRGQRYFTGCLSQCDNITDVSNGSCSGVGCCQSPIPKGNKDFNISTRSFDNHIYVTSFNPCSYAFVVANDVFNFSSLDLSNLRNKSEFPVVLNWAIGNENCSEAKKNSSSYGCTENTNCTDSENGPGYLCSCLDGYQGNPYLPNGCEDIDECKTLKPCNLTATCNNLPGSYSCSCLDGYEGDGLKNGTGCSPKVNHQSKRLSVIEIALVIGIGVLVLILGITWLCWGLKTRKQIKLKQKFFEQNGGILLHQQLSEGDGSSDTTKIYTANELIKATNNYHESRILGQGGQGTVYRGIIDNKEVAIKVSKGIDQSQVKQFVNEVILLSQINHRNVVKLLGCCLETPVPQLVYEYVTNGTLSEHIHNVGQESLVPWETRLKIATEAAGAISYLHSAASIPIIHRDIKSANILLDDNFTTKVSDFGSSRLIPLDHTQLTTLVQGTLGYLDPEYMQTNLLSEKSDVYSFGIVLMELLTGKQAFSSARPEAERVLAPYVVSMMKEDRLFEVLDHQVLNERNVEQVKEVAKLARRCVRVNGGERPTMKEVANALENLRAVEQHERGKADMNSEENEFFDGELLNTYRGGLRSSSTTGYDSIGNQVPFDLDGGR